MAVEIVTFLAGLVLGAVAGYNLNEASAFVRGYEEGQSDCEVHGDVPMVPGRMDREA